MKFRWFEGPQMPESVGDIVIDDNKLDYDDIDDFDSDENDEVESDLNEKSDSEDDECLSENEF